MFVHLFFVFNSNEMLDFAKYFNDHMDRNKVLDDDDDDDD